MNKGLFGFGRPLPGQSRSTPIWEQLRIYDVAGAFSNIYVPDDVYTIGVAVAGGGGAGASNGGGGGGGFAYATFDVMPGQLLPTITVGAAIKRVNEFPEMILRAVETDNPAVVAGYALELARDYNSYYEACAVMEAGELKYPYRLIITQSVAQVLDNALTLCHARGPERI